MVIFFVYIPIRTQEPSPTPADVPVRVITEEVKLNVMARSYGRFVPTLKPDDLLVVEGGTPQAITSMRRVPANVLLMLDTGGDLNYAKSTELTKLAAKLMIGNLSREDSVAVMQYNDKIEIIADWTQDREAIFEGLDKRLFSGKRSRFSDGLNAAVGIFYSRPLENRHLVLISDGLESVADDAQRQIALLNILAANVTIHVLSYTKLEAKPTKKAAQRVTLGKGDTKPRVPEFVLEERLRSVAISDPKQKEKVQRFLRSANESQRLVIISLDSKRINVLRKKVEDLQKSETTMKTLSEDTGGVFQAPEEAITVFEFAVEIANVIGSQYVITYSPAKAITEDSPLETRKVRVGTHCPGVEIRSRQKLILKRPTPLLRQ